MSMGCAACVLFLSQVAAWVADISSTAEPFGDATAAIWIPRKLSHNRIAAGMEKKLPSELYQKPR